MSEEWDIPKHYTHGDLLAAIETAVRTMGKTPVSITVDDLSAVDEFHIGGRAATRHLFEQLHLSADQHLLDVGCGLGGAARFAASAYGVTVAGIDATPEYIETGRVLNRWVGLDDRVTLRQGSALGLPFNDAQFDGCYIIHVGMNIADKRRLFSEIYRVMKPGGLFGIYDIMLIGDGTLSYPVPWASAPRESHLEPPQVYEQVMTSCGLTVTAVHNRRYFAVQFFEAVQSKVAENGLPPLGLHTLMGESAPLKLKNMIGNVMAGHIAPVEIIAVKS